jgi:hypothetical protein
MPLPLLAAVPAVLVAVMRLAAVVRFFGVVGGWLARGSWLGARFASLFGTAYGTLFGVAIVVDDVNGDDDWKEKFTLGRRAIAAISNYFYETSFTAEDLLNEESIGKALAREIGKRTGIPMRNIFNKEETIEDFEQLALRQIELRSGYKLSTLRSVEQLKRDFARIAGGEISERIGLPLSNILDVDTTKSEVLDWAQDQVMMRISDSVSEAVSTQIATGGKSLLQAIRDKVGKKVSGKSLLRGVNDALVGRYMVRWEAYNNISKEDRRKVQLKLAQRRFRDRSNPKSEIYDGRTGGRMEYVPKGWNYSATQPNVPVQKLSQLKRLGKSLLEKAKGGSNPAPTEAQVP